MKPRERTEHRVIDGKPVGIHTTVEHLKFEGGAYEQTEVEKWKTVALLLGVLLTLIIGAWLKAWLGAWILLAIWVVMFVAGNCGAQIRALCLTVYARLRN